MLPISVCSMFLAGFVLLHQLGLQDACISKIAVADISMFLLLLFLAQCSVLSSVVVQGHLEMTGRE